MISFMNQSYKLPLHSLKIHPVYLHKQSVLMPKYYSNCSKYPPTSFTQAWSFIHHSSSAHPTMLCDKPSHVSISCSYIGHVLIWRLINTITHHHRTFGLSSGPLRGHKSREWNLWVSRWRRKRHQQWHDCMAASPASVLHRNNNNKIIRYYMSMQLTWSIDWVGFNVPVNTL